MHSQSKENCTNLTNTLMTLNKSLKICQAVSNWGMSLLEKCNYGSEKEMWKCAETWGSTIKKEIGFVENIQGPSLVQHITDFRPLVSGQKYQPRYNIQLWFTVQMFQHASKLVFFTSQAQLDLTNGLWLILATLRLSVIISQQETHPIHHSLELVIHPKR